MREPNARLRLPREKFELSLDGRQVAAAVVAALVLLAVVFVLGLTVGKQIATRLAERPAAGDLEALDRAPAAAPVKDEALTFHDRLTKGTPAQLPPAPAPAPLVSPRPLAAAGPGTGASTAAASTPAATPNPTPAPSAPATGTAKAAPPPPRETLGLTIPARTAPSPGASGPPERGAPAEAEARSRRAVKPWTVQVAAAHDRAEAERIAGKLTKLDARVEEADLPGKGRFYRVRVGSFDSRELAERYLRDVARETGAKGFVTATR